MQKLYIIAGCNGAGKTTASYTMLPELLHCHEFVNADEIARGLSPFNPDSMAIEAGRLMLRRINDLLPDFFFCHGLFLLYFRQTGNGSKHRQDTCQNGCGDQ